MLVMLKKTLATALLLSLANLAIAQGTIKMGALATLEGAF
ncbi:uncharacterized protein METZ01_LOCUS477805, partial [marine metagenome]